MISSYFCRLRTSSHDSTGDPIGPEMRHASQLGWYPAHLTNAHLPFTSKTSSTS